MNMNTDPCGDKDCPCVELIKRLSARIEHRTECEAWQCGTCSGGSEKEQIHALHVFTKAQIPVEVESNGVFLIGEGRRRFYFWPKSAKWRAKGRAKVYRSRGPEHVAEILQREQKGVVMTFDDLYREILKILPEATMGEDNEGQLIVYTDRMIDPHGDGEKLLSFKPYRTQLLEISPETKDRPMKSNLREWLTTWPPKEQMLGMCDWGNCSADPVVARYHKRPLKKDSKWLPVCSDCAKKEGP